MREKVFPNLVLDQNRKQVGSTQENLAEEADLHPVYVGEGRRAKTRCI